jgi:hypothetical protein
MSLKIFFSHAWKDKAEANVKILMNELRKVENYDVWLDRYEIQLGENINSVIEKAIEECDVIIVAWSRNANESKHVLEELKFAHAYQKPIVPCIIDGYLHTDNEYIAGLEWIEVKGNHKHDLPQLAILRDYLISLDLKKTSERIHDEETQQLYQDVEKKHKVTSNLMKELEDIHHRQKMGVSGNEASDVFVQSALTEAINVANMNSNSKIQEFFVRMMEATQKFPGPENNETKVNYLMQTIVDLDPDGTDIQFQKFYQGALETFGLMTGNTTALTNPKEVAAKNEVTKDVEENSEAGREMQEMAEELPSGSFFDNAWFGVRLYIGQGKVEEEYPNGCKVNFPGYGVATIYFYYNFHTNTNDVATYLNGCLKKMIDNGTHVQTGEFETPSNGCVALEMAYYNSNNELQYEYFGGYCLSDNRGVIIEIITSDEQVRKLYRDLFANKLYLLNGSYPEDQQDTQLFHRLANRKLLFLQTSSSGYGSFYSSSSTQRHFKLYDSGEFEFYYLATNSGSIGTVNSEERGSGRWGVYVADGQSHIWYKWHEGQYELCTLSFGNDADLYMNKTRYYIVSLDYRV